MGVWRLGSRLARGVEAEPVVLAVLAISGLLTLACWVSLWRGQHRLRAKLAWTFVSALPIIGPLLYGGMHDPPSVQADLDRARRSSGWDVPPDDDGHE